MLPTTDPGIATGVLPFRSLLAAAALGAAIAAPANAQWTVVFLDPPGAVTCECHRMENGQQVGFANFGNGPEAVRWSGSAASLVSLHPAGSSQSFARGTNGTRQAGFASPNSSHAGYWTGTAGSFVDLHPAGANATESYAFDLSGNSLVGEARVNNITRASVWNLTTGAWTSLHPTGPSLPPTYSTIYATDGIQHGGGAVYGNQHAMVWDAATGGYTDLHPAAAVSSFVLDVHLGQQVGRAMIGTNNRASLWTGTAASWVDLTPATSARAILYGVHQGQQVGEAAVSIYLHAGIWQGTSASWTDLHGYLPTAYTGSQAFGIWHDVLGTTYVVGVGYTAGHNRAVMWVKNAAAWSDVGFAKNGAFGPPALVGTGPLTANSNNTVTLTGTINNTSTLLVVGVLGAYTPFLGGVLVPDPMIVVPQQTNAIGSVAWQFVLPALPPGLPLRFQYWITDANASFGYAASNGLLGICQ